MSLLLALQPSSGSSLTVQLSGNKITSAIGSLGVASSVGLTGNAAGFAAGAPYVPPVLSLLQAWTSTGTGAAASVGLAYTNVPTAGNLLVCAFATDSTKTLTSITDNIGDGVNWTLARGPDASAFSGSNLYTYYKVVGTPSGGNKTVTVLQSGSGVLTMGLAEYATDKPGTWSIDGTPVGTSGNSTDPTAGSITTAASTSIIVSQVMSGGSDPTAGSGFTVRNVFTPFIYFQDIEDQITTSANAYSVAWVNAVSNQWTAQGTAFTLTPVPTIILGLTGQAASFAQGNMTPSGGSSTVTVGATGNAASFNRGHLYPPTNSAFTPANLSDVVLCAVNEEGANNSTTFVDQSTNNWTLTPFHAAKWSNNQAPAVTSTSLFVDGADAGTPSGDVAARHSELAVGPSGGSAGLYMGSSDFCIEQVIWVNQYTDTVGTKENVSFSFGPGGGSACCLEVSFADLSTYGGAAARTCYVRANYAGAGATDWHMFGGISGVNFNSNVEVPAQQWFYVKVSRVSNVWKIRLGSLLSGTATVSGTENTLTDSRGLYDISSLGAGAYGVNIGADGGSGNKGFDGNIAFTRLTKGSSVAAMDVDGIPILPLQLPSANVTVGATGNSGVFAQGAMGVTLNPSLIGNAGTFAKGTPVPSISIALIGNSLTATAGVLLPGDGEFLTGQAGAFAQGAMAPSISVTLTGNAGTFAAGTPTGLTLIGLTLTGSASAFAQGAPLPSISVGSTGNAAAFAQGAMTPDTGSGNITVAATGNSGTFAQGAPTPGSSIGLTGNAGTFVAGTPTGLTSLNPTLTGNAASFAQGAMAVSSAVGLTGSALTSASGSPAPAISVTPSGQAGTFAQGAMTPDTTGNVTVALTGNAGAFNAGTLVADTGVVNNVIWTQGTHGGGGASSGQPQQYDWRSVNDLFKQSKPVDDSARRAAEHRAQVLAEDEFVLSVIIAAITEGIT